MIESIVRIQETIDASGLYQWQILGLNIYAMNDVEANPLTDPRLGALKFLVADHRSSILIGGPRLRAMGYQSRDVLGNDLKVSNDRVQVGIGRSFYSLEEYPGEPAWFIPSVKESFFTHLAPDGDIDALYLMWADALVILIGGDPRLTGKSLPTFQNTSQYLNELTDLYDLVIHTAGWGYRFSAYARAKELIDIFHPAIKMATDHVRSSEWYRQHEKELTWDSSSGCLVLPSSPPSNP